MCFVSKTDLFFFLFFAFIFDNNKFYFVSLCMCKKTFFSNMFYVSVVSYIIYEVFPIFFHKQYNYIICMHIVNL